jgi:hypothetical protein
VISFQSWIYGAWGATIAGWSIFLTFISSTLSKQRNNWSWNCLVFGLPSASYWILEFPKKFGVNYNIFFNMFVAMALGLPLIFSRNEFVR